MLVLSRKINEKILIGHDAAIVITVVDVRGDRVTLGIDAPKEIPVHRQEVFERIHQAAKLSAELEAQEYEDRQ